MLLQNLFYFFQYHLQLDVAFHQKIVRAERFASFYVVALPQIGKDDHRYVIELDILLDSFQHFKPVFLGKHQIKQYYIGQRFFHLLDSLFAVVRREHFISDNAQLGLIYFIKHHIVFNDEHFHVLFRVFHIILYYHIHKQMGNAMNGFGLRNYPFCHSRESGNPGLAVPYWIPSQAGNDTEKARCGLNKRKNTDGKTGIANMFRDRDSKHYSVNAFFALIREKASVAMAKNSSTSRIASMFGILKQYARYWNF